MEKMIDKYDRNNILFLDFDGVCNSFETGSYLTHEPSEYGPDPKIIKRVREICKDGNARIIISSNWRRFDKDGTYVFDGIRYKNPLGGLYSMIGDLIDGTLTVERHLTKAQALILWFEDHPDFRGRFAVVDDDPREGIQNDEFLRQNFWHTDMKHGLTESIKKEIISHFNGIE